MQEAADVMFAPHSAYSYEDLNSDRLGADFGANYFDPNSTLTLGEQIETYMNSIGATSPGSAPNYHRMPLNDAEVLERGTPTETNRRATPSHRGVRSPDRRVEPPGPLQPTTA